MDDNYTYISDLFKEVEIPKDGILNRILLKYSQVNATSFGFDAGQVLSEHTAGSPAIVQILKGEAALTIAGEEMSAGPGTWAPCACSHSPQPRRQDTCRHALAVVEFPGLTHCSANLYTWVATYGQKLRFVVYMSDTCLSTRPGHSIVRSARADQSHDKHCQLAPCVHSLLMARLCGAFL